LQKKNSPCGTALITGAAQRIGRVIAQMFGNNGWAVAIHYNTSAENAKILVEEIQSTGGQAAMFQADLAVENNILKLVDSVNKSFGPITCLVNNASIFEYDDIKTSTQLLWNLHMTVNLRAPFLLIQRMARQLPRNTKGNVINIIDQRVWNPTPDFISYTLSKMSLWNLTQTLAMALAPCIRVNAIGPGPVYPSKRQTNTDFKNQWAQLPLSRRITPEEIAAGVRYILDAKAMTGQMIALDSGEHLGWSPSSNGKAIE